MIIYTFFLINKAILSISFTENISDVVNYAVEVEVFGGSSEDFMQEMMSPTFIVLASCVAFATLVVVLLIGLICNKLCRSKAQNNGYTVANCQVNIRIKL